MLSLKHILIVFLVLHCYLIFLQILKIGRGYNMSKMSRDKGQRGEREVAALMKTHGFEAERGQQRSGSPDSPDVKHNIPGIYVEVKRCEALGLYPALEQASRDATGGSAAPVVFHRRSRKPYLIIMDANDFLKIMRRYENYRSFQEDA